MLSRLRVFIACSLDGFIAGPDDDLSWLPKGGADVDHGYRAFIADVGALLVGRNTYRVVEGFSEWPYGDLPVLVATHKEIASPPPTVRAVSGPIADLVARAREVAGDKDVYLDGGDLIRQALDAGLVDELTVSIIPTVLGAGSPLFAGVTQRRAFDLVATRAFTAGMVQLTLRPQAKDSAS